MVEIALLGPMTVTGVDGPVPSTVFGGRRTRVALGVLAFEPGQAIDLQTLAEALWPTQLPPTWHSAIRSALSRVREVLAAAGVADPELRSADGCVELVLGHDVQIDVEAARDAAHRADALLASGDVGDAVVVASHARTILRRPLLPAEGSEWAEQCRHDLRRLYTHVTSTLTRALIRSGDTDGAIAGAEDLIRIEPYVELGHRLLMAAHDAAGNRAEALRAYNRCRRLLAEELGVQPSPETEAEYLDLLGISNDGGTRSRR